MLSKIALVFSICTLVSTFWLHINTQGKIDVQKLKISHLNNYSNIFWPLKGLRFPTVSNDNKSGARINYGLKGRYCESSPLGGAMFNFVLDRQTFYFGDIVREQGKSLAFDLEAEGDYLFKGDSVIMTGNSYKKIKNFTYSILTIDDDSSENEILVTGFGDKYHWYTREACNKYKSAEFSKVKIPK